jgi:hypothetical protein
VCGAHELALLYFPSLDVTGVRPYDDMLGFGDAKPDYEPGIGCSACGSQWNSLEEFRAAQRGEEPAPESD